MQVPVATVPVQTSTPSVTLTFPVGVPAPATVKFTVTACPALDGSGLSEVIEVDVFVLLTVCEFAAEVLALKLESPPYVPVIEYDPAPGKAIVQEPAPAVNVAIQELVPPSETVTEPAIVVGVTTTPGTTAATVTLKVTVCPMLEGSGLSDVMVVVVLALFTVWEAEPEAGLALKLVSPA